MSQFENKKAAALKYDGTNRAPVIVASGSGNIAQKIVNVAQENKVPIYQDNSLVTLLTQLQVGKEIPEELYQSIVDIYVYFLKYNLNEEDKEILSTSENESNTSEDEMQDHEISKEEKSEYLTQKKGQHLDISIGD